MADVTVVEEVPPATTETADVIAEAPVITEGAVEAAADAAVEVARIEAERDVTVAAIAAETARDTNETIREDVDGERDEWRQSIEARLAASENQGQEILSTLTALTERLQPSPPESQENPAAMPESREVPEPAPVKKRPHHRLI